MKIDLHCHTKKIKKGDGKSRNVTPELFRKKIELAEIKIVAITNHNAFDYNQYVILCDAVKDICQVWPGVEIDIQGETNFHLIVITKPESAALFNVAVTSLFQDDDVNTVKHSIEETVCVFSAFDCIYIPHFHNKKPAISEGDRDKLIRLVGNKDYVFIEPRDHRTLGVLVSNDYSAILGSDVKDWNHYEECTFSNLRLPVGSFSEFILLAKRDKNIVKTLLSQKSPINVVCHPHPSVSFQVELYPDVNIIFGPKGTGKTEILLSVYQSFVAKGINSLKYIASERSEDFSALLSIRDMELDLKKVYADACQEEFKYLHEWKDTNPTSISSYVNWISTKDNSNNKARMKITEAVHYRYSKSDKYHKHCSDKDAIVEIDEKLHSVGIEEYLSPLDIDTLKRILSYLKQQIFERREDDLIEEYTYKLVNYSIDQIKKISDKNSDTVSRPSELGLEKFAENRLLLLDAINKILINLSVGEHNEKVRIGSLEDKGNIYVNYKYRMLCPEERTDNYPGYKITALRDIVEKIRGIKEHIFDVDLSTRVEELNTLCDENKITSLKPFLGRSKQVVTETGEIYEPSNGEKGILLLQQILHDDADAYFLDEPELGMGSSYIDSDIRPIIESLAKQRKYVVVATHNANIAVRTLPYVSIFRVHENGYYKTYVGNPFNDLLVNIENNNDIRSWSEESMHTLEGGKAAFYERRDIYESKNS